MGEGEGVLTQAPLTPNPPTAPSRLAKSLGAPGRVWRREVGRPLTEALHGIRAEDLVGPLRPEVVTGNIFTVASTEHQLVAVFFLLRSQILLG